MAISYLNAQPAFVAGEGSGGTEVTSGGYKYHTFTSSGTFTVTAPGTFEVLVIGGGGAGGNGGGGGGGAGGLSQQTIYLPTGATSVTIGAGATAVDDGDISLLNLIGSTSVCGSVTAVGGGSGGSRSAGFNNPENRGFDGGSGGGTSKDSYTKPAGQPIITGQGNAGGDAAVQNTTSIGGSGGGGAGAVGGQGNSSEQAGDGGAGSNTYSTWATATSTGDSGYYAGGGGGSTNSSTAGVNGSGGSGGGGDGGLNNLAAQAGTANTGGGGGAGAFSTNTIGGNGGSGLVIIRYAV